MKAGGRHIPVANASKLNTEIRNFSESSGIGEFGSSNKYLYTKLNSYHHIFSIFGNGADW
jgi:hypothetical protein